MTHKEKRERRRAIAGAVAYGMSIPQVARKFDVSFTTIKDVIREFAIPLRPKASVVRDKSIALKVKSGQTLEEVASETGVSIDTAARACKSHNVAYRKSALGPGSGPTRSFRILADLISKAMDQSEIAEKYHITRQAVGDIKARAIEAGILKALLE